MLFFMILIPHFLFGNVFGHLHYPIDVITRCVRWYLAYSLSLRNLEEMMAKRGIVVNYSLSIKVGPTPTNPMKIRLR